MGNINNKYSNILFKLALKAYRKNEVPVSAIIVYKDKIISRSYNQKNLKSIALFHAEIICIYKACKKLKRWNLEGCKMYITLEPCDMCKNAIQEARLDEVYYILSKGTITNRYIKTKYEQMYVSNADKYEEMLKTFFKQMRK